MGLTGLGFLFLLLGVLFFFDRGLLAMGNVRTAAESCVQRWRVLATDRLSDYGPPRCITCRCCSSQAWP